ncbi:peptidyl-prolyl cis-trans isomerase H [Penicillium chermesinum]|uniref:Peptidyl-prolyl cis-trans isomerase n=1 Tax=Penicillium chermesinum TaxID=63820 RepID=A0A9W9TXI7_9EURO|nr:peptidyl-prolyl cis-trans isomerase H [Penicillium chermesinum]KAJ5246952.1 peptidyl-prolyl cis-trans isomerase H [Penicillium chermesinum]
MTEPAASESANPVVFFDITLGGEALGRVKMELYANVTPRTAENFRQFCTGESKTPKGKPQGYKEASSTGSYVKDFMIQGGDFVNGDGTGSCNIYGSSKFADENFALSHDRPGLLSMANSGPNSNGCQFFITTAPAPFLNNKHVVFGQVTDGMDIVRMIEKTRTNAHEKPIQDVTIIQCGEM